MERMPYVYVCVNGKTELWPYPEAQEFTIYKFSKSDIIWLNDKEFEELVRKEEE